MSNKCPSVCEQVEVGERNKGHIPTDRKKYVNKNWHKNLTICGKNTFTLVGYYYQKLPHNK